MNKFIKVTSLLFLSALLLISAVSANENLNKKTFGSFIGKVKEITPFYNTDGSVIKGKNFVLTENEEGSVTNFIVNSDTYIASDDDISVGDTIEGFYDATIPVIMIYPPQYVAEVVAVKLPESQNIKVERFDTNLLSYDNELKLNISDDTEIILEDGTAFDGSLKDRQLAVFYTFTSKSLPPQTTPSKIVVLFEKAINPIMVLPSEPSNIADYKLVVANEIIETPRPFTKDNGAVMVPLRIIAEKLGFTVNWDDVNKTVYLNYNISLKPSEDYYTFNKMAPISLGTAPEIVNDLTYVPLNFFTKVAGVNNAYIFEAQIVIDNFEKMN